MKNALRSAIIVCLAACIGMSPALAQGNGSPYFTDKTRVFHKYQDFHKLGQESDGVITLLDETTPRSYCFIETTGNIVSQQFWEAPESAYDADPPRFDNGVCAVRNIQSKRLAILYKNGQYLLLPETISEMSPFKDGVAMVVEDGERLNYYYIDYTGKKVYPHLSESVYDYFFDCRIRPVKCGLRAYYSHESRAWGYLNENGTIAIEPKFSDVRDFANGYALVRLKNEDGEPVVIIDKSGKVVKTVQEYSYQMPGKDEITDVSESGMYSVAGFKANISYYSVHKEGTVFQTNMGTHLVGGHTFILDESVSSTPGVYDENFSRVGQWQDEYVNMHFFSASYPANGCVVLDKRIVLDPLGNLLLSIPDESYYELGEFSENGIAAIKSVGNKTFAADPENGRPDKVKEKFKYTGYCKEDGELLLVFCVLPKSTSARLEDLVIDGYKTVFNIHDTFSYGGTVKAIYSNGSVVDVTNNSKFSGYDMSVAGNQTVTVEYMGLKRAYNIWVKGEEEEIEIPKDSIIKIVIKKKEWEKPQKKPEKKPEEKTINEIYREILSPEDAVIAICIDGKEVDITEKVKIIGFDPTNKEKQTIEIEYQGFKIPYTIDSQEIPYALELGNTKPIPAPGKIGYIGNYTLEIYGQTKLRVPLWLELKDEYLPFPYSNNIKGFLTAAFDPGDELTLTLPQAAANITMHFFMAPMAVYDIESDTITGKTYLILGGGCFEISNVDVKPKDPSYEFTANEKSILRRIHTVHEYSGSTLGKGLYRLEICNGSLESESFTFGKMERFSFVDNKWKDVNDCEFQTSEKIKTYILSFTDIGKFLLFDKKEVRIYEEVFNNQKMTKVTGRPDIYWHPTVEFYPEDTTLEEIINGIQNLDKQYETHKKP